MKLLITCVLIIAIIISAAFNNWGLTESSEARYAEISREMHITGDYIQPKLLGIHHYHKPPVTYYITSLGYSIFGINEYGARFFLHIALLFQLLLVYKIAQLLYSDENLSLAATLIYFSYPIVQVAANNLTTDAYLTTFIFSSIFFFLKYRQNRAVIYIYLFYIFCGISFLTKGPVGILPQALFALLYVRVHKLKSASNIHTLLAIVLGVVISASWFIMLLSQNENLLNYFVKHQLVDRVSGDSFKRSEPFWYYLVFMPLLGLPAFYYFLNYLIIHVRSIHFRRNLSAILLITLAISLLVFSTSSSKLILYVLPLYLFIAILSAKHLSAVTLKTTKLFTNISLIFSCFLFVSLIAACFIKQVPLVLPATTVILLSVIGIVCMLICNAIKFKAQYLKAPFINAIGMVVLTFLFPFIMRANDLKINSVKLVANFIKEHSKNEKQGSIAVYDYLLPSLSFYTNEKIITLNNGNSITQRETQFETNETEWQNSYFKLMDNRDSAKLSSILSQPNSYIIAQKKNSIPDSLSFLRQNLKHEVVMEKWVIYY